MLDYNMPVVTSTEMFVWVIPDLTRIALNVTNLDDSMRFMNFLKVYETHFAFQRVRYKECLSSLG